MKRTNSTGDSLTRPGRVAEHMTRARDSARAVVTGPADPRMRGQVAEPAELGRAIGDLSKLLRALAPVVLGSETVLLDANGQATRNYRVPFDALAVESFSGSQLTVTNGTPQDKAPATGAGVARVKPGGFRVVNMRGYAWTIYGGQPGDTVTVECFGRPVPAAATTIEPGTASDYPLGAVPVTGPSGNQANAQAVATLAGVAGKTTYITGFQVTAAGATAGLAVSVSVAGVAGGPLAYVFAFPAGPNVAAAPLVVNFAKPVPAAAAATPITVTLPASGAGGLFASVNAEGYQL